MTEFADLLMKVINEPGPPFRFQVGHKVRVCVKVLEDGQTPLEWAGAVCEVLSRRHTMFGKNSIYYLQHPNGMEDYFEEEELDFRYRKKDWESSSERSACH